MDDSEAGYLCVYDIFKYTNGRGKKAQIAINSGYNKDNDGAIHRCVELYLLDVPGTNDPRVRAYLAQHYKGKEPPLGDKLCLRENGGVDRPIGVLRKGIVFAYIGEGLNDKQKEFIAYVMKSKAR